VRRYPYKPLAFRDISCASRLGNLFVTKRCSDARCAAAGVNFAAFAADNAGRLYSDED